MKTWLYSFSHPQPATTSPPIQNTEPSDIDGAMLDQMEVAKEYRLGHDKVKKWMASAKKDQGASSQVNKYYTVACTNVI